MKRLFKYILSILFLGIFSVSGDAQQLLSSNFSQDTILIGDQVEWSAKVKVPQDVTVWLDSLSNPVVPGVELISGFTFDTISSKKRKELDIELKAILTSFDSGSYYLPRQVIYFYKGEELVDTLVLNERNLEVTTVPIDTTTYEMFDIKPQIKYPVTFKVVFPWVLAGLAILGLIYVLFVLLKRRRENRPVFGKPVVQDPPHIVALRNLEKIREQKLWQSNKEKEFYTEVTETMREYIESRYNLPTFEKTTAEIMDSLVGAGAQGEEFEELKEMFSVADLVKFAKYKATEAENERAIPVAVRYVNATYITKIEEESDNG